MQRIGMIVTHHPSPTSKHIALHGLRRLEVS